jgi:hypothetical protein
VPPCPAATKPSPRPLLRAFPPTDIAQATVDMSSSPHPESSGNESAEQQLFAESQASPLIPQQPPTTTAIRSAHLLNAARVDKLRPASHIGSSSTLDNPEDMVSRNGGASRLKRPSFIRGDLARNPRQNLTRRGDVYDLDLESPQKNGGAPYKLSETVNRSKPLKRVKKGNNASIRGDEPDATAQPIRSVDEDEPPIVETEALRLSSPPTGTALDADESAEKEPTKSGRLAGKPEGISRVDSGKKPTTLPPKNTRFKRKATSGGSAPDRPSKSPRREKSDTPELSIAESHINEEHSTRSKVATIIPKGKKRKGGPGRGRKGVVLVNGAYERSARASVETDPIASEKPSGRPKPVSKPEDIAAAQPKGKQTRSNTKLATQTPLDRSRRVRPGNDPTEEELLEEVVWDSEQLAPGGQDHQDVSPEVERSRTESSEAETTPRSAFEQVLAFAELEKRRGKCQTDQAADIKRSCRAGKLLFQQPGTTAEEVSASIQELRAILSEYGASSDPEERSQLKVDAYGYLFRELVACLVQLHGWVERSYDEVTESLEAVYFLLSLSQAIISFKDAIASWKIPLPTRYKNDNLVKRVDIKLIAPLRRVVNSYRSNFSELKAAEHARKKHEELRRKKEEASEEQKRKESSINLQREKWNRWQDLHVWRQKCEPDPIQRRHLFIDPALFAARFENSDERDANGIKFERIPLFKERDSPPRRPSAGAEEEWTDEQMAALVEGLTNFAGK